MHKKEGVCLAFLTFVLSSEPENSHTDNMVKIPCYNYSLSHYCQCFMESSHSKSGMLNITLLVLKMASDVFETLSCKVHPVSDTNQTAVPDHEYFLRTVITPIYKVLLKVILIYSIWKIV